MKTKPGMPRPDCQDGAEVKPVDRLVVASPLFCAALETGPGGAGRGGQHGQNSGGGLGFFLALGWGDGEGDPGAQGGGGILDLADARGVAGVE